MPRAVITTESRSAPTAVVIARPRRRWEPLRPARGSRGCKRRRRGPSCLRAASRLLARGHRFALGRHFLELQLIGELVEGHGAGDVTEGRAVDGRADLHLNGDLAGHTLDHD